MSSKKVVNIAAYIFIILIVLFVFFKGKHTEKPAFSEIYSMNTICDIEIYGKEKNAALNKVIEVIQQVNKLVDDFSSESDVYRINENAGIKPVKVSRMTLDMIEKSIAIARETNGAFDPAIYPLLKLWGFKDKNYRVPTKVSIKNTLKLISYKDVVIDNVEGTVFLKKKGEGIDLGGTAKGYTLDKIKEALRQFDISGALVNMGGNVLTYKDPPEGNVWKIGIKNPRKSGVIGIINIKGTKFISTSGDYERYFIKNGIRYCHIMDPETGRPARKIISVTVISNAGYLGDALSTAFFVQGKSYALYNSSKFGVGVIGFDNNLKPFMSPDLENSVTIYNEAR